MNGGKIPSQKDAGLTSDPHPTGEKPAVIAVLLRQAAQNGAREYMVQHIYLFELKSIQAYITRTGRLRDLTNLSDLLDRLMDDCEKKEEDDSILQMVLNEVDPEGKVQFIRRKGGAIHAFCAEVGILRKFRSVWTMLIQQMFPYLQFTDYLGSLDERADVGDAMDEAFRLLNASVNAPVATLPAATALIQANSRTGLADIPVPFTGFSEIANESDDCDLTTLRTCKTIRNLRRNLYHKFFNEKAADPRSEPTLSQKFKSSFDRLQREISKDEDGSSGSTDIAYIHFDGNSIGKTAISIRKDIKGRPLEDQKEILRTFSRIIADATQKAVAETLTELADEARSAGNDSDGIFRLRPLVLGGDDVTLLIDPRYALDFASKFCTKFEIQTSKQISSAMEFRDLATFRKKPRLTASGGILFNKISHPATNTHALVEGLAEKAKHLTKSNKRREAAVAFYRMSSTASEPFEEIMQKGRRFQIGSKTITVGTCCCYVSEQDLDSATPGISDFLELINAVKADKGSSSIMQKFRIMLSELAKGDEYEADRVYHFMMDKSHVSEELKEKIKKFFFLVNRDPGAASFDWCQKSTNGDLSTPLADLLVLAHYTLDGQGKQDSWKDTPSDQQEEQE